MMIIRQEQVRLEKAMEFLLYNFFDPSLSHLPPDVVFDSGEIDLWSNHYEEGDVYNIWPGALRMRLPLKLDYFPSRAEREDFRCRKIIELEMTFTGEDHCFSIEKGVPKYNHSCVFCSCYIYGDVELSNVHRLGTFEDGPWREQILFEARRRGMFREVV